MWRTTPMRRQEISAALPSAPPHLLSYPAELSRYQLQTHDDGCGPLFHRLYRTRIRGTTVTADELMQSVQSDLNRAAPTKFARFQLIRGERGALKRGDEYVVRMPGPWDGPV